MISLINPWPRHTTSMACPGVAFQLHPVRTRYLPTILRAPGGLTQGTQAARAARGGEVALLHSLPEVQGPLEVDGCDGGILLWAPHCWQAQLDAGALAQGHPGGCGGPPTGAGWGGGVRAEGGLRGSKVGGGEAGGVVVGSGGLAQGRGHNVEQGHGGFQGQAQQLPGEAQGQLRSPHRRV